MSSIIKSSLILVLLVVSAQAAELGKMITGSKSGTYYAMGKEMSFLMKKAGHSLDVLSSQGSQQNLDTLYGLNDEKGVHFGLVQYDALYLNDMKRNKNVGKSIYENVKALLHMHSEELHFIKKKGSRITLPSGRNLIINCGAKHSGSCLSAQIVSSLLKQKFDYSYLPHEKGLKLLQEGKIDLVLMVIGKPAKLLKNLQGIDLVPAPSHPMLGMLYGTSKLTSNDYAWLEKPVEVLNVDAAIVTNHVGKAGEESVKTFMTTLLKNRELLQQKGHSKWKEVKFDTTDKKRGHPIANALIQSQK